MNNLRKIRRLKDITQYELCQKAGIAQSSLSLIERGYRNPDRKMKKRLSSALKCRIDELFPEDAGEGNK
jgi:transcriptional regulator with XRE-family HTH domain